MAICVNKPRVTKEEIWNQRGKYVSDYLKHPLYYHTCHKRRHPQSKWKYVSHYSKHPLYYHTCHKRRHPQSKWTYDSDYSKHPLYYHTVSAVELSGDKRRLQIEITIYPDNLLFISAGFLPRVSPQQLNGSSLRPQSYYEDDRTKPYFRCRATYIRIQALLQSTPVPFVIATTPVEERAISPTDDLAGCTQIIPDS